MLAAAIKPVERQRESCERAIARARSQRQARPPASRCLATAASANVGGNEHSGLGHGSRKNLGIVGGKKLVNQVLPHFRLEPGTTAQERHYLTRR